MAIKNALPCPFCGSTNHKWEKEFTTDYTNDPGFLIRCRKCDGSGPLARDRPRALERWNDRPPRSKVEPPQLDDFKQKMAARSLQDFENQMYGKFPTDDPQPIPIGSWEDFNRQMTYTEFAINDNTPGTDLDTTSCIHYLYEALTILAAKVRNP